MKIKDRRKRVSDCWFELKGSSKLLFKSPATTQPAHCLRTVAMEPYRPRRQSTVHVGTLPTRSCSEEATKGTFFCTTKDFDSNGYWRRKNSMKRQKSSVEGQKA